MTNRLIYSSLFVLLISCTNTSICFNDFSIINQQVLPFHMLRLDTSHYEDRYPLDKGIQYLIGYRVWTLHEQYQIKHYSSNRVPKELDDHLEIDSLSIYDQKFAINDLYYQSVVQIEDYDYRDSPFCSYVYSIYEFSFTDKNYLLFHIIDRQGSGHRPFYFSVLFDISRRDKVIPIPIGLVFNSKNPHYIGDFNNDNRLDFAWWDLATYIYGFSLDNHNQFKQDTSRYIVLDYEEKSDVYKINTEQSRWFFPWVPPTQLPAECRIRSISPDYVHNMYTNYRSRK